MHRLACNLSLRWTCTTLQLGMTKLALHQHLLGTAVYLAGSYLHGYLRVLILSINKHVNRVRRCFHSTGYSTSRQMSDRHAWYFTQTSTLSAMVLISTHSTPLVFGPRTRNVLIYFHSSFITNFIKMKM